MKPLIVVAAVLLAAACIRNPATGRRQLVLVSQKQEIELGQQTKRQVEQSIPLYDHPQAQSYVSRVGTQLARLSERPGLPWSFQILDDPSVNAFALPGGPIFITRGLLTHMSSEGELASVLGHEIAHVTARHAVDQISRAQLAQLGLGLGAIFVPDFGQFGGLFATGAQVLFLKYGRDDELEADGLGLKYAYRARYDVREMKSLFSTLDRVGKKEGSRLPQWLSTHPSPANRRQEIDEELAELGAVDFDRLVLGRDAYLERIDGFVFGEDPRQGFFRGQIFYHPRLAFELHFPTSWRTQNQPALVVGVSPAEDAAILLGVAGTQSPERSMQQFFAQSGVSPVGEPTTRLHELPSLSSYFQAQTEQGMVAGVVSFLAYGGRTYQILAYTPRQRLSAYQAAFETSVSSFARVTDRSVLDVQPARIQVFTAPVEMSVRELYQRFPSTVPLEEVALINGLWVDGKVLQGQKFKRVVGGLTPSVVSQK
ncbi:MAG: M48 family metalloprotease [Myxococcota bacterium]